MSIKKHHMALITRTTDNNILLVPKLRIPLGTSRSCRLQAALQISDSCVASSVRISRHRLILME